MAGAAEAMLVGVVSDTHDYIRGIRLAARFFLDNRVELVIHLGDVVSPFALREFANQGIKRLILVFGNNDGDKLLLKWVADKHGFEVYEAPHILEVGGKRLLLMHGKGPLEETRRYVEAYAKSGLFDAVLYGHTHQQHVESVGNTLILNPGEACGCFTGRVTAALLDLKRMEARVEVLGEREDKL